MNKFAQPSDPSDNHSPNPRVRYTAPELLMADGGLGDSEKLELLRGWQLDLDNRLLAESEGMSSSDPMRAERESWLADESRRVATLLAALDTRLKGQ